MDDKERLERLSIAEQLRKIHPYRKACEVVNNLVRNNVPIPFEHTLYDPK